MEKQAFKIDGIPSFLWGKRAKKVFLYVHGQGGSKEEAAILAEIVCPKGFQVLSIDLPQHGERKKESSSSFTPWDVEADLKKLMCYAKSHWETVSLFANSIGAWFSLLFFQEERLEKCLFLSPVVDMKALVSKMMLWAHVSESQLQAEQNIQTNFGQTLSWEYWIYILAHPITKWAFPTAILYGEKDHLVGAKEIQRFSAQFHCPLTVMENGEHWFHTDAQLLFAQKWIKENT